MIIDRTGLGSAAKQADNIPSHSGSTCNKDTTAETEYTIMMTVAGPIHQRNKMENIMLNKLKKAISEKGNAVGTFLGVSTPSIVEILGYTGLDFVVIDTEHGPYDTMPVSDLIRASDGSGMASVVRVADVTHKGLCAKGHFHVQRQLFA